LKFILHSAFGLINLRLLKLKANGWGAMQHFQIFSCIVSTTSVLTFLIVDTGLVLQLKDLTVVELKYYLTGHNLPVSGKKEALVSRILTHMGK